MPDKNNKKGISLIALVALVVSGSIGAGIFAISKDLSGAAPGPALLAWLFIGIGILMLAVAMSNIVLAKPKLTGLPDYAKDGFGDFSGFISGWGYWLSAWLGNVGFALVLMQTLGYFFPVLKSGNSVPAIVLASVISWGIVGLVSRGFESATSINTIATIAKIIPLLIFIVFGMLMFKVDVFTANFWNNLHQNFSWTGTGGVLSQMRSALMVLMWVFVGIEGATIMAGRANKKSDAAKATIFGVLILLVIYILASILPYGYFTQEQLVNIKEPSMVYLFSKMVGDWGGVLISIGMILSIMAAWLSWTLLPVETTSQMADLKLLPAWFGKLNKKQVPINALIFTQVLVQIMLVVMTFSANAYQFAYSLATSATMITYSFVAAYQIKLGWQTKKKSWILIGTLALIFQLFVIDLAGLSYLWLMAIAYIPGFILLAITFRKNKRKFSRIEIVLMAFITILAISAIGALINHTILI